MIFISEISIASYKERLRSIACVLDIDPSIVESISIDVE